MRAEDLYERYKARVYHLCLRYSGGRPSWAEDMTHDVFVRLFERLDEIDEAGNVDGFVHRVTVNHCLSHCRREGAIWTRVKRSLRLQAEQRPRDPDPLTEVERSQSLELIRRTLGELSPLERSVFAMKHFEELSQVQIAEQLSLSNGYVSKLLRRAEKRIRHLLE